MKKLILLFILAACFAAHGQSPLKPQPTMVVQKTPENAYRVRYWNGTGLKKIECISFHSFGGVTTLLVLEKGKLKKREIGTAAISGVINIKTGKRVAL